VRKEIIFIIAGLITALLVGCYSTSETVSDGGTPIHVCTCLCLVKAPYYTGCAYREAETTVVDDASCKAACAATGGTCGSYQYKCSDYP
jgi:hypothetical protein